MLFPEIVLSFGWVVILFSWTLLWMNGIREIIFKLIDKKIEEKASLIEELKEKCDKMENAIEKFREENNEFVKLVDKQMKETISKLAADNAKFASFVKVEFDKLQKESETKIRKIEAYLSRKDGQRPAPKVNPHGPPVVNESPKTPDTKTPPTDRPLPPTDRPLPPTDRPLPPTDRPLPPSFNRSPRTPDTKLIPSKEWDKEYSIKKIKENPKSYASIPKKLIDENFIIELIKANTEVIKYIPNYQNFPFSLWVNIVSIDGLLLRLVPKGISRYEDICITAVKQNPLALEFVPDGYALGYHNELNALKVNGMALKFCKYTGIVWESYLNASDEPREHTYRETEKIEQFYLQAVTTSPMAIQFISERDRTAKICEAAYKEPEARMFIPEMWLSHCKRIEEKKDSS